jgi:hypothetical protein
MAEREGGLQRQDEEFEQFRAWMHGEGEDPYRFKEEEPSATEEEEPKEPPPSVENRKRRQFGVTFSDPEILTRLRQLAEEWHLFVPYRDDPAVSELIEYLLVPRLEAAEQGEVEPPTREWRSTRGS